MEERKAGAVLVKHPQFDKIAALTVLERHLQIPLPVVRFWETNDEPDTEIIESWLRRNLVPIDIGADKYHTRGTASALESVVIDYQIPREPPLCDLLAMVGQNNQTGDLKGHHESIVWTLREMYKLDYDPREVIDAVKHVVNCYLDAHATDDNLAPFTIHSYIRNMSRLGLQKDDILAKANYFLNAWKRAKEEQAKAKKEVSEGNGYRIIYRFGIQGRPAVLVKLTSDNSYVTRELLNRFFLVIVRNRNNHVAIQTKGGQLSSLAENLRKQESRLWFYDARLPALLNGSRQYKCEPTAINDPELVNLVVRHVSFRNK